MIRSLTTILALTVLGLLAACNGHPGRVLVVVESDYPVPAGLSEVVVLVGPVDDPESRTGQAFVLTALKPSPAGLNNLPLSLVVVPRNRDSDRHIDIVVEGRSAATGDVLVRSTRVLEGFRANDTIVLPIFLSRSCQGSVWLECAPGQTCVDGECELSAVDPGTLRIAQEPGEELRGRLDASTAMDTGVEPLDGGPADSGDVDSAQDTSVRPDAGVCGAPVRVPFRAITGADELYPLTPAPGVWMYNAQIRDYVPYVEWEHTAPAGCEISRIELIIPDAVPEDPLVDCRGLSCAMSATPMASYEIYRDGSTTPDEFLRRSQVGVSGSIAYDLTPAQTISVRMSDWTPIRGAVKDYFIIVHDAVFHMRPVP